AAKEYSIKAAYPGKEFPMVDDNARCVLCHQELTDEAPQRLQDFERFIKSELETEAKRAEEDFHNAIVRLPTAPEKDSLEAQRETAGIDDQLLEEIKEYWETVSEKVRELKDINAGEEYEG